MEKQLLYNSVTCLNCGETLESLHRHDYKTCSCENKTMVDGGESYHRCGGKDLSLVKSNCLYSDDAHEKLREVVSRGGRGKNGDEELKYVLLKDVDDEWLEAIIEYEELNRPNNKYLPVYREEVKLRDL